MVLTGLHRSTQAQWSIVQKFIEKHVPEVPRPIGNPQVDSAADDETFCIMTFIFCRSKQHAYCCYEAIDSAISSKKPDKFGIRSDHLAVHFRNNKPKYDPKQTLILKNLHNDLKNNWVLVRNFIKEATNYALNISSALESSPAGHREFKLMARIYYESPNVAKIAKIEIDNAIITVKSKRESNYSNFQRCKVSIMVGSDQSDCRPDINSTVPVDLGDPKSFFYSLKARTSIEDLFVKIRVLQAGKMTKRRKNGILISGTGTGKTVGTALLAGLSDIKAFIVVPKVVQVILLVNLLKSVFKKDKRIGYSAGGDKDYDLSGAYDIIIVTYGHFLRKLVGMFLTFETKHACISASSHNESSYEYSDYLLVLDEVHEPMSEIQTVLLLCDRIDNQKIIVSATLSKQMISTYARPAASFVTVEHEVEQTFPTTVSYESVDDPFHKEFVIKTICTIVRRYIDRSEVEMNPRYATDRRFFGADGKVLIFVPGVSYIDSVISALLREKIVYAYEISEVHSELWEDQILEAVSNYRVIVGTNIVESSVTIDNLKVVIDTMLKNEVAGDMLREVLISKAEAKQRAGRVGRTAPGKIHRLVREKRQCLVIRGLPPTALCEEVRNIVDNALSRIGESADMHRFQTSIEDCNGSPSSSNSKQAVLGFDHEHSASALQRALACYFGANVAGPVSRLKLSDVLRGFESLDDYPTQPFDLNDPHHEFLLLSKAFKFRSEVEEILKLDPSQALRCKSFLKRCGAVKRGKLTDFGKKLLSLPLSIKYACPVAHMFSPSPGNEPADSRSSGRAWQMFALLVALAFENFPTWLFDVPREMRVERDRTSTMQLVSDACEGFGGSCLVGVVLRIFLEAVFDSGALAPTEARPARSAASSAASERLDRWRLRSWCGGKRLNSKYVNRVLMSLMRACEATFKGDVLFGPRSSLVDFMPMTALRDLFRTQDGDRFERNLERGMRAFGPYFRSRYLHLAEPGERGFLHATAGFSGADPSWVEQCTRRGPFPLVAGALRESARMRNGRASRPQLAGVFPVRLESLLESARGGDEADRRVVAEAVRRLAARGSEGKRG